MDPNVFTDYSLTCRLERAEAVANARFVEARARLIPDSGAQWIEVAGVYATSNFVGPPAHLRSGEWQSLKCERADREGRRRQF